MAIEVKVDLNNGIVVDGAYVRVENISLTKDNMSFNIRKYVSPDKPFFNEDYITSLYDINGANPFVQAYEYIKTLEEFSTSVDC